MVIKRRIVGRVMAIDAAERKRNQSLIEFDDLKDTVIATALPKRRGRGAEKRPETERTLDSF